ncbi:RHS repeat-associated core domain-containing protein [Cohnella silvisoli]|uniref:RHS repeat-associated core domain-containing protein n=1 Tax=Cohnella silvisoli TaxID=2873699 RepID=A0ABV1KZE5_9BACL|nr:RHS repeat-associated core domain-containing protein [Cohnella silvisoli]MCD9024487.1 hypothetical protein [Cohnella silvisoli]
MRIKMRLYKLTIYLLLVSLIFGIVPENLVQAKKSEGTEQQDTAKKEAKSKRKKLSESFGISEKDVQRLLDQGYTADEVNIILLKQEEQSIPLDKALGKAKKHVNRSKSASKITNAQPHVRYGVGNELDSSSTTESDNEIVNSASSQPVSPVSDETLKNLKLKLDQAPYSVGSMGQSVSTLDGSLSLGSTDFVLPGRNGLSFALSRNYNSGVAQYYEQSISYYNDLYKNGVFFSGNAKKYALLFAPVFSMSHTRDYATCSGVIMNNEIIGTDDWNLTQTSLKYDDALALAAQVESQKPMYTSAWSACTNNVQKRDIYRYIFNSVYVDSVGEQFTNQQVHDEYSFGLYDTLAEATAVKQQIDAIAGSSTLYLGDTISGTNSTSYTYYRYYVDAGSTASIRSIPTEGHWYPYQTTTKTYNDLNFPIGKGWSWNIPYILDGQYINLGNGGQYEISGNQLKGYQWNDLTFTTQSGTISVNQTNQSYSYVLSNIDGVKQYFNSAGQIIKMTDKYNNFIDFGYQNVAAYGRNLLTSINDPVGNTISIQYTTSNVILTSGNRTITYTKVAVQNGGNTVEILDRVTDPESRVTRYEYNQVTDTRYNVINTNVNEGIFNGYSLLKTVFHPSGAESHIKYEDLPTTRLQSATAVNQVHRVLWTEDRILTTNPDTQAVTYTPYNRLNYTYNGDAGSSYNTDYAFSTTINDGLSQVTYQYDKDYIDANNPTVFYNTTVKQTKSGLETTISNSFDRSRKITTPIQSSTLYKNTQTNENRTETTSQTFDNAGNVLTQTDKQGVTIQYTYYPNTHLIQTISQPIDSSRTLFTQVTKTASGDPDVIQVRETNGTGSLLSMKDYDYDSYGNVQKITTKKDATNETVQQFAYSTQYNSAYLTSEQVSGKDADNTPFSVNVQAEYNALTGQMTKFIDGKTNATIYQYDKLGRVKLVTNPDNSTTSVVYDDTNNKVTQTNEEGARTESRYDSLGRLMQQGIFFNGNYTAKIKYFYDTYGRNIGAEDAEGNKTTVSYAPQAWGEKVITTSPNQDQSTEEVNVIALTKNVTDPLGNRVTTKADILGNPIQTVTTEVDSTNPAINTTSQVEEMTYNYLGGLLTHKDAKNNLTQYTYDFVGRLTKVTNALNEQTSYQYDLLGNLLTITNPNQSVTTKQYDELGRLIAQQKTSQPLEKYYYDANNNLKKRIDRKGNELTYSYNSRSQLESQSNGEQTSSFTYSHDGLRLTMQDVTGLTKFDYHPDTRQLEKVTYPDNKVLSYTYDPRGNIDTLVGPFNDSATYDYDTDNRLQFINLGADVQYQYYANGSLKQETRGNGVVSAYQYKGLQLTALTHTNPDLTSAVERYAYDGNKNITMITQNGTVRDYTYDALNRVETASPNNESYTYDQQGNRSTLESDQVQQLTPTGYEYDRWNQLTSVTVENSTPVTYKYNGDGLMVERTQGGNTTRYYYSGSDIIAEGKVNPDGTVSKVAAYIRGNGLEYRVDANGNKAYYVRNSHGDVVSLQDANGQVLNSYTYDLWGKPISKQETVSNPFLYSGEYWDSTTNLQYLRARWYDPSVGRFINEDTYEGQINNPLTLNLYTYVVNNPLIYTDPSGHCFTSWLGKSVCQRAWKATKETVNDVGDSLVEGWNSFSNGITTAWNEVKDALGTAAYVNYYFLKQDQKTLEDPNASLEDKALAVMGFLSLGRSNFADALFDASKYRVFNSGNFNFNLRIFRGSPPSDMIKPEAHHILPQAGKFSDFFNDRGINVHDPRFGTWVAKKEHGSWSNQYTKEWETFIARNQNATADDVLSFGRSLGSKYKFEVNY